MKRIVAALSLSSLVLAGCGFTPMYSTTSGLEAGAIEIAQIDGYGGNAMRKELLMLLRPGLPGVDGGLLEVDAEEDIRNFDFSPTGTTSRTRITVVAKYTLTTADGVLSGRVEGEANTAPADLPYADIAARREASTKAALDAATKLADDLRLKSGDPSAFTPVSG